MIESKSLGIDLLSTPLRKAIPESLGNARRIVEERLDEGEDRFAERVYPNGFPARQLKIPGLHVVGWWDNLKPWHMPDWDDVSAHAPAREHQFMLASAVDHRDLRFSLTGRAQDDHLHGDDEALRRYLPRMLDLPISFFEHYLSGSEGVWPGPRVRYELTNVGWRSAEQWPPVPSRTEVLYLAGDRLTALPAVETQAISWVHNPLNPVPVLAENDYEILLDLPDETSLHDREDVVTFTGEPLGWPLDIVGRPAVQLTIDAESPSTDVIATLCDIDPTGRGWMISEASVRVDTRRGPVSTDLPLGDLAYRVLPGHRLRLAIQTSRFARYAVHPGNGVDIWESGERTRARQTLHVGGDAGGTLTLPLAEADEQT